MQKIIWTCWFQGRRNAPDLVQRCITSWEVHNPGWQVRCLDATTIGHYLDLSDFVDLTRQTLTAASLSDLVRVLLLHEYGGVWVDATLYCNQPLDSWLPGASGTGFFAFASPTPDRLLSSWFLTARPDHHLIRGWAALATSYWRGRTESDDYFWFHHLFAQLCESDPDARAAWDSVPRISADGPHALQWPGLLYEPASTAIAKVDWTIPVFKLTHRIDEGARKPGCLLDHILQRNQPTSNGRHGVLHMLQRRFQPTTPSPVRFAGLKLKTENLGDHIQLIAANRLLKRIGIEPDCLVDRDDEIASADALNHGSEPVGILLNGWFKTNPAEWPPHPRLVPIYLGFHIRLFQSPSLVSEAALQHYRQYAPIGCRDLYTQSLLQHHGVDAFHSNCLSLTLPRRLEHPRRQTEVFVVSRDERLQDYIPPQLQPYTFVKQYSGSSDFEDNMQHAEALLHMYRTRARLIVTTLLHCALAAIAMGIPVVVFYPINPDQQHRSDRERFSSLERLIRVYNLNETDKVDWRGRVVDVSHVKLSLLDDFYRLAARWHPPGPEPIAPIASADRLPVPA
jgi:hypothetical protein